MIQYLNKINVKVETDFLFLNVSDNKNLPIFTYFVQKITALSPI